VEAIREIADPDLVLATNWGVETAEHHGVEGLLDAITELGAAWDPWQQEVERVIDAGQDRVVALMRLTAQGRDSGVPVRFRWAMVMTISDGRLSASRVFVDQDEALKAAGLEA
jgi:ketosteroid isomerase-like protein